MLIEQHLPDRLNLQLRMLEESPGQLEGFFRINAARNTTTLEGMMGRVAIDRLTGKCYAPESVDDLFFYGSAARLKTNYNTGKVPPRVKVQDYLDTSQTFAEIPVPELQLSPDRKRLLQEFAELVAARLPHWDARLDKYELMNGSAVSGKQWEEQHAISVWSSSRGTKAIHTYCGSYSHGKPGGFTLWPFQFSKDAERLRSYHGLEFQRSRDAIYIAELPDTQMLSTPMGGMPPWAKALMR